MFNESSGAVLFTIQDEMKRRPSTSSFSHAQVRDFVITDRPRTLHKDRASFTIRFSNSICKFVFKFLSSSFSFFLFLSFFFFLIAKVPSNVLLRYEMRNLWSRSERGAQTRMKTSFSWYLQVLYLRSEGIFVVCNVKRAATRIVRDDIIPRLQTWENDEHEETIIDQAVPPFNF